MSNTPLEYTLVDIYNRIAPQIKIDGLTAKVNFSSSDFAFGEVTGIEITSGDGNQHAELSLESENDEDEDINNFIWTYTDLRSGWGTDSEVSSNASDEEVVEFFKATHLKNMEASAKR